MQVMWCARRVLHVDGVEVARGIEGEAAAARSGVFGTLMHVRDHAF